MRGLSWSRTGVALPPPLQANEAATSTDAASGDAPPPIKAGPFGIPIPSLDGTADGTGGVAYGAQLTFAKRFSEVRAPGSPRSRDIHISTKVGVDSAALIALEKHGC